MTATGTHSAATPPAEEEPQRSPDGEAWRTAVAQLPAPADLRRRAARDYRERARFPAWSRPTFGIDPLRRDREVTPGRSLPYDAWPQLIVAPDRSSYSAPDVVRIQATLLSAEGATDEAEVSGELRSDRGELLASLDFRGADGSYRAEIEPAELTDGAGRAYLVRVEAVTPDGTLRAAQAGFLYSAPGAALTGRYRDAIVNGNLEIEIEVEAFLDARAHLEATLADDAGTPLVWAQTAAHLEAGTSWLTLEFYGLALREAGRDGPYRLASLALTTVDGMPNRKNALVRDAHRTEAYAASEFHATPFDDPELLRTARELDGDEARTAP